MLLDGLTENGPVLVPDKATLEVGSRQIRDGGIFERVNQLIPYRNDILFRHSHLFQYPLKNDRLPQFIKCIQVLDFIFKKHPVKRHVAMCHDLDMIIPAKIMPGFVRQSNAETRTQFDGCNDI